MILPRSFLAVLLLLTFSTSFAQERLESEVQNEGASAATNLDSFSRFYRSRFSEYEVTITNLTYNQIFAPSLVVSHRRSISLFQVGEPASEGIAIMAEDGNVGAIVESVDGDRRVRGN